MAYGSNEIGNFLNNKLNTLQLDAANRGLRGQAYTQLQGDAVKNSAQLLQERVLAANNVAAGQAIQLPGQRVNTQASVAGQGLDFANVLQQRAFDNRSVLQNPILLQQLQNERLNTATTKGFPQSTQAPVNNYQPVVSNAPDPFTAGLGGALQGASAGLNLYNSLPNRTQATGFTNIGGRKVGGLSPQQSADYITG